MKKYLSAFLTSLLFTSASVATPVEYSTQGRTYLEASPTRHNNVMILALHGGGGFAKYQADHYGLEAWAKQYGWVVVYPNGYSRLPSGKFATWNAGNCCGAARDKNSDDVQFLDYVINDVVQRHGMQRPKIFVTGMSNGAMMAYRYACERPERVTALAAVAGTDNSNCTPTKPVPMLHIHAKDDTHVLFNGGAGPEAFEGRENAVTSFTSVAKSLDKWMRVNRSGGVATTVYSQGDARCERMPEGVEVRWCITETGGHSWPGMKSMRKSSNTSLDATDYIGKFFKSYAP